MILYFILKNNMQYLLQKTTFKDLLKTFKVCFDLNRMIRNECFYIQKASRIFFLNCLHHSTLQFFKAKR